MVLKFKNSLDKKVYTFSQITDINDSKMFFHFNIQLPEGMPDGSYTYALYDDNNVQIANGQAQVGDFKGKAEATTAYTKNNEFIQYNG